MILWEKEKLLPTIVPPFVRSSEHLGLFILLVSLHGLGRFTRSCSGCNGALGGIVGLRPRTLSYYLTTPCDDSRMEGLAKICTPDHVDETMYFLLSCCAFGRVTVLFCTIFCSVELLDLRFLILWPNKRSEAHTTLLGFCFPLPPKGNPVEQSSMDLNATFPTLCSRSLVLSFARFL
jgi:hypothetical protein